MAERIVIKNMQAPGDYIVLTAAIRELKLAYPGRFHFGIHTHDTHLFQNNPHIDLSLKRVEGVREVVAKYPMVHQSNQNRMHFMQAFLEYLNGQLGTQAKLTEFRPDLYLTDEEKACPPLGVVKPYWVMASGGKTDFTAKWWDSARWQEVVNQMSSWTQVVQVGGKGANNDHRHPALLNTTNLIQKTTFRELMQLIYHSEGVLCVVTCLMHIAAAFNKSCVVVAGGREPYYWEAYTKESRLACMRRGIPNWEPPVNDTFVPHRFLHTVGTGVDPLAFVKCSQNGGCWKDRVGTKDLRAKYSICQDQVQYPTKYLPKCLDLITPEHVLSAVESYYSGGYLKRIASVAAKVIHAPAPVPVETPPVVTKEDWFGLVKTKETSTVIQQTGAKAAELGTGLVWLDHPLKPRKQAQPEWEAEVKELSKVTPIGIVSWCELTPDLVAWAKKHYPETPSFDKHPMDPKRNIVYYPRKGFLALPAAVVALVDWTYKPDLSDDPELFEKRLGVLLHALNLDLRDAGHLIRGA